MYTTPSLKAGVVVLQAHPSVLKLQSSCGGTFSERRTVGTDASEASFAVGCSATGRGWGGVFAGKAYMWPSAEPA